MPQTRPDSRRKPRDWMRRLAWLPLPLLAWAIVALRIADLRFAWPVPLLFELIQYSAGVLGIAFIVVPAARSFAVNGQLTFLMLGCGVLMSQVGATVMPLVSPHGLNRGFEVYNTSVLLSGLCQFIGVAIASRRKSPVRRPTAWLAAGYAGSLVVMGLLIWGAGTGRMPAFFIEGRGETPLRGLVVSGAAVFFLLTAGLLWRMNRRASSPFHYWYALGMALVAIGLAGSMAIAVMDSPMQWVTRATQILGLIYMCVAVLVSARRIGPLRFPGEFTLDAAVEALRESESLLHAFFDDPGMLRGIVELSNGRLRWVSASTAAAGVYGLEPDAVRGRFLDELGVPAEISRTYVDRCEESLRTGLPVSFEVFRHLAGGDRWLQVTVGHLGTESGGCPRFAYVMLDITKRRAAEEALRESEERYRVLVESSNSVILRADRDLNITYMNEFGLRFFGYTAEELYGKNAVGTIIPPVDDEGRDLAAMAHEITRQPGQYETNVHKNMRNGGKLVWMSWTNKVSHDPDGEPAGILAIGNDISELVKTQDALHVMHERLVLAQTSAGAGFWDWDLRTDRLDWSPELFRLLGLDPGKTDPGFDAWRGALHPEDREAAEERIATAVRDRVRLQSEYRVVWPSGEVRWISALGDTRYDASGAAMSMSGLCLDITERKRMERALREMNDSLELRVAERTAEVQRLADQLRALAVDLSQAEQRERKRLAAILHDHIQQLLVAARLQVEFLKRDGNRERRNATAQGIDGILREALDASRSLTVELSPPVLHEAGLIGALNWLASRTLERNQFAVRLRADNKAEPPEEETRFLLFECARELLLNAMKHSGSSEAQVTLVRTEDGWIKLIVRDEGRGFDPDLLQNRRADEVSFGLFNIQQRLAHVGGDMKIVTAPGKGTNITVTIPVVDTEPVPASADQVAPMEVKPANVLLHKKTAGCRVLIVDDHKIMREGLAGLMQFEPDIEVVGQAADGRQAIALAESLEPDVIVMDVNLVGMSGVEATRRILAVNPNVKVIGLSMHTDKDVAGAMRDAGAAAYLTKGGPSADLLAAIRAVSVG